MEMTQNGEHGRCLQVFGGCWEPLFLEKLYVTGWGGGTVAVIDSDIVYSVDIYNYKIIGETCLAIDASVTPWMA